MAIHSHGVGFGWCVHHRQVANELLIESRDTVLNRFFFLYLMVNGFRMIPIRYPVATAMFRYFHERQRHLSIAHEKLFQSFSFGLFGFNKMYSLFSLVVVNTLYIVFSLSDRDIRARTRMLEKLLANS